MMMVQQSLVLAVVCFSSLTAALQLVHPGATVPLAEDGYQQIAAMKSDVEMEVFVKRFLESRSLYSKNDAELSGFVQWFSGTKAVQNFAQLGTEVANKPWVVSMTAWPVAAMLAMQNQTNTTANFTAATPAAAAMSASTSAVAPQVLDVVGTFVNITVDSRLGPHRISYDGGVPVTEGMERGSRQLTTLPQGTIVTIQEVGEEEDGRLRVRIEDPSGWISLKHDSANVEFAVPVSQGKNCLAYCGTHGLSWGAKCMWSSKDCSSCTECEQVSVQKTMSETQEQEQQKVHAAAPILFTAVKTNKTESQEAKEELETVANETEIKKEIKQIAADVSLAKKAAPAKTEEESKKSASLKKPTKNIGAKVENAFGSVWKSFFKHSGAAKEAEKTQQKKSEVEPTVKKTEALVQKTTEILQENSTVQASSVADASTEMNFTVTENITMESSETEASSETSETESNETEASSETEALEVSMNDSLNVSLNASRKVAISAHHHKKFAHKKTGVATALIATQARAHASMSTVKMADKMSVPALSMTDLKVLTKDHRNQLFEAMGEDSKVVVETDGGVAHEKTIREVVALLEHKRVHPASKKEDTSKVAKGKHQKHASNTSKTSKASKASKAGKHTVSLSKKVNGKTVAKKTIANKTSYSCEHKCFKSTKAWAGVKCRWSSCAGCGQCTPDNMKGTANETHMDMISYDEDDAEEETQSASPLDSVKSWFSKILGSKDSTDAKVTEEASAAAAGFPTRSRDDKKHQTLRHNTTAKLLSKQSLRDEAAKEYTLSDEKDYLAPANEKLSDLEQQIKELKGNLEDADKDARLAARDKKKEFESHLHVQESNITRLTNENKHIQGDIDKLTKTNTKLHKHALTLQKDGAALKKQLLNLQEELSSADDFAVDAQQVGANVTDKVLVLRELEAREAVEQKVKQRKSAYKDVAGDELEDEETASLLQVGVDSLLDAESALVNLLDADKKPSHKHKKTHAIVAAAETKAADAVAAAAAAAESFNLDGSSDTKAATLVDDMAIAFARLDSDMEMSLDELEEDFTNRSTAYTLQEEALEEKQAELLVEKKAVKVLHSRLQDTIKHLSDGIATLQEQVKSLRTFLSHVGKDTVADDSEKKDAKKAAAKTQHVSKPHAATHKAELIKKQAERSHEATEIITYAGEKETGKTTKHKPLSAKTAHKTHQK